MPTRKVKTKAPKKSNKRSKINKKNVEFYIIAIKIYKIFRIMITIISLFVLIYLFSILYKHNSFKKFYSQCNSFLSDTFYSNICSNVDIIGVDRSNINTIKEEVYNYCKLYNKNNLNNLLEKLKNDPWIKNITIRRKLPNSLIVDIDEYLPFAMWKNGDQINLIDENGKIIEINEDEKKEYYNLIIVAGENSKENIYGLFNLLSSNPELFLRIKSAIMIGKRRWNLELDNGILIKMPEKNILDAWFKLDKILSIKGSEIGLKTIDLRDSDKVFLEENE